MTMPEIGKLYKTNRALFYHPIKGDNAIDWQQSPVLPANSALILVKVADDIYYSFLWGNKKIIVIFLPGYQTKSSTLPSDFEDCLDLC